jgi:predicted ester cyclase
MAMSEANKSLVRRLVEDVMNRGKLELLDELCAPTLAAQFRQAFSEFRVGFPDWQEEVVELVSEGDHIAGRFTCSGTHLGPFMGQAATGKRIERIHEVIFFRVHEGRLTDAWALEDTWTRMEQLGLLPMG